MVDFEESPCFVGLHRADDTGMLVMIVTGSKA
jgi:hypothetical protein